MIYFKPEGKAAAHEADLGGSKVPIADVGSLGKEMTFSTIRDDIHGRYNRLSKLVGESFPQDPRGSDAFKLALELYLQALPELESIDGWALLIVVEETPEALRAVGISYVLPSSELPIEASFRFASGVIEYQILVGSDDKVWSSRTESKRWNAVYQYATEGTEPEWNWGPPITGVFGA